MSEAKSKPGESRYSRGAFWVGRERYFLDYGLTVRADEFGQWWIEPKWLGVVRGGFLKVHVPEEVSRLAESALRIGPYEHQLQAVEDLRKLQSHYWRITLNQVKKRMRLFRRLRRHLMAEGPEEEEP